MNTEKAKELKKDLEEDVGINFATSDLKNFINKDDKIGKIKCVKWQLNGTDTFIILSIKEFRSDMEGFVDSFEIGDKYNLEVFEMPVADFYKLPEFEGF